ncbi:uncharacterized protein LOC135492556 [Lineus longissimus]|uniref:uncharacterized protein LOC135492556 n=1 Tax=Lineus longissimus TaxID=88925 RepID=UPI00315D2C73
MGSSPSSPSDSSLNQKTGNAWTKTLFFDPEADKPQKQEHTFPDDELLSKMKSLTTSIYQRQITRVRVHTAAHTKNWKDYVPFNQHVPFFKHGTHIFLVVRVDTETWFSLEINNGGITIQQSQRLDAVTKFCRDRTRTNVDGPKEDFKKHSSCAKVTLGDLLAWLQKRSKQWRQSNCYDFATEMFEYLTETALEITKPEDVCGDEIIPDEEGKYYAYFNAEADPDKGSSKYWITDDQLKHLLESYLDADEKIRTVTVYKKPLSEKQLTFVLFYHLFIIFQTDTWWWSIEKNKEGLTIQRSKEQEAVRDSYRREPRLTKGKNYWEVTEVQSDAGNKTIKELIVWLEDKKWLFRTYHYSSSNCQHFGKAVFDYVSKHDLLNIAT